MPRPKPADQASAPDDPLATSFFQYLSVERNASPRTLRNYELALRRFRQDCKGFADWKQCSATDFRAWLFTLMKRELGRATIRLHFAALRSFFKWLTVFSSHIINRMDLCKNGRAKFFYQKIRWCNFLKTHVQQDFHRPFCHPTAARDDNTEGGEIGLFVNA